jgi:hypothetical protein
MQKRGREREDLVTETTTKGKVREGRGEVIHVLIEIVAEV